MLFKVAAATQTRGIQEPMALLDRFLPREDRDPDDVRMTLGEHLDELRARLIRCLIGLTLGAVLCAFFIDDIEGGLTSALFDVMRRHGYSPDMTYTGIAEPFLADFQLILILGLIVSAPYILMQLWGFVASGLYKHERAWVRRFVPVSIGLFFAGAAFFIVIVIPLFLDFFIGYKKDLPANTTYIDIFEHSAPTSTQPAIWPAGAPGAVRDYPADPKDPPNGALWINHRTNELRTRIGDKTWVVGLLKEADKNRLTPMIRIQEYLVFMLQMAAAFGFGFQVPVVVALLATIGVASAQQMGKARKYVWFGIAIAAAFITPSPDLTSLMLLFIPMVLLYEAGLLAARMIERKKVAA